MLDVSIDKKVAGAKHWSAPVDQLYRPTSIFDQDSQDLVYVQEATISPKFTPILLKELFYIVKKDGYLVIDYRPTLNLNWSDIEELLWWLWKSKYQIIYHQVVTKDQMEDLSEEKIKEFIVKMSELSVSSPTVDNSQTGSHLFRLVCQKIVSTKISTDSIDRWTFGIITNGQREDWVEKIIKSIRSQKIPNYEILMCGVYKDKKEKDIRYIPFNDRDEMGWITRKKNIIARQAKYENLCIIHNRMVFADDWYQGMKKWGNCFEVLNTLQIQKSTGHRGNHWEKTDLALYKQVSQYNQIKKLHFTSDLDYKDWSKDIYQYGQAIIIKRSIMMASPQNETLYWGMLEDHIFSIDFSDKGYLLRLNPYSIIYNLDDKKWSNNIKLKYSPVSESYKFEGPFIKLLYRKIMRTLLAPFKYYKLLN